MQVTFNLPHITRPGSSTEEKESVLRVLLGCLKRIRTETIDGGKAGLSSRGQYFTFDLPNVFVRNADARNNSIALNALLEALTNINEIYLTRHPDTPHLYESGVRYGRTQLWEPIPALYARQSGDCKSLSAALIAEYRRARMNAKPVFRFKPRPNEKGIDYHILVLTARGWEDPSKALGMGQDENAWFRQQ